MTTDASSLRPVPDPASSPRANEVARTVASAMLGLYLLATLMVPAAAANKVVFLAMLGLVMLVPFASAGRVRVRLYSPVIVIAVFLYGYLLAFIGVTDPALTTQLMLSVSVLMLIYLIDWFAIDLEYQVKLAGVLLCLFTAFAIYAVTIVPNSALGVFFIDYFINYSLGASGARAFSDSALFMFRIGPVPFLFLPFCLLMISFLDQRRVRDLLGLLLVSTVILVSTSRALVLCCLLAFGYLVIRRMRPSRQVIALCVCSGLGIFFAAYLMAETTIFSLTETSNRIKIGHVASFIDHMTPSRLMFGDGLAATYFSSGYNEIAAQTEITLLDNIRYFGLPLTAVLYAALLFPVPRRSSYTGQNQVAFVLFGIYLVMSMTNPVLFNSFGLIVVVWYWSRILAAPAQPVAAA